MSTVTAQLALTCGVNSIGRFPEGKPSPPHTPIIPEDLGEYVEPVFTALSRTDLLERCGSGETQNQNESFNNIIWTRCPKTGFCSLITVEVAVNLAIFTFNHGIEGLLPLVERVVGSPPGAHTAEFSALQDAKTVMKAHQKAES